MQENYKEFYIRNRKQIKLFLHSSQQFVSHKIRLPAHLFSLSRGVIEVERYQGSLSWLHFGDDNNVPLFHLYILGNWSVVRNNHRFKTMVDALVL